MFYDYHAIESGEREKKIHWQGNKNIRKMRMCDSWNKLHVELVEMKVKLIRHGIVILPLIPTPSFHRMLFGLVYGDERMNVLLSAAFILFSIMTEKIIDFLLCTPRKCSWCCQHSEQDPRCLLLGFSLAMQTSSRRSGDIKYCSLLGNLCFLCVYYILFSLEIIILFVCKFNFEFYWTETDFHCKGHPFLVHV